MPGLADELRALAQAWADRTASEQGLGGKVDGEPLASVALLLGAEVSSAPNGRQARVVELARPPHTGGTDDQVIKHGGDDLLLAS